MADNYMSSADPQASTATLHHTSAPLPFLHPTQAHGGEKSPVTWASRSSRKNRYSPKEVDIHHPYGQLDVESSDEQKHEVHRTANVRAKHIHSSFKLHLSWDVSFWVAVIFTLGSVAWVINGFLLYLPLLNEGPDQSVQAAAWAFVGGTLFNVGSYLMVVEALNTGHGTLFGPAVEDMFEHGQKAVDPGGETFHWWGRGSWRDLGYLASTIQLFAATVFWISTITGLPGVIPGFPAASSVAITDIFFWTPQVIGGTGFVISSLLLMIETQSKWYKPNLVSLGWHIGLWNLIGAVGFLLCGAFGYASLGPSWINYQSVLSTYWGSWAFLIGSGIQLWETLWREDDI